MSGENDSRSPFKVTDRRAGSEPLEPNEPNASGDSNVANTAVTQAPEDTARTHEAEPTMPPADFTTFVLSLSTSCLLQLGDAQLPGVERQVDLEMARHTIDLLSMLEQKTQGNLTGEEERLMSQILYDLRMRYVAKAKG